MGVPGARMVAELEGENKQLRKELAQMRKEREIVKKAAAYSGRIRPLIPRPCGHPWGRSDVG